MAGLATPRPGHARPERPGRGRPGRPVRPVRLADRAARRGLERARRVGRRGGSRRRRRSRRTTLARTGRPAYPADALPDRLAAAIARRLDGRPAGPHRPRPARPHRVRARRLAQGPRDPARRGPAVRLGRRRDRPPEGGPGGRHGARPQPGAADRAVPPRRPDGRHDRPVLARRARRTSGRSWRPRASTSTAMERLAASGVRFIGSDTTKIFCLPTCRHARRVTDRHRLEFRSLADGRARGLPCLQGLPAGVGGRRRLSRGSRAGGADRTIRDLDGVTARCLYSGYLGPLRLCQPRPRPRRAGRADLARDARPLRRVGLDLPRRSPIAVETIPPFLMAAVRFVAGRA